MWCDGFALVGGNSNNGANAGAFYVNLNNAFSNRNWNIAASQTYLMILLKCTAFSVPLGKNESNASNCAYVIINVLKTNLDAVMFTAGSTPPETYIPYGYKLPLTITSGTESKEADIFIGDSKLLTNDYLDYETGKIVRNGTLQDPPKQFPKIDTYIGINTLDSVETLGEVTIKGRIKEVE